jgi:hypothetical protein
MAKEKGILISIRRRKQTKTAGKINTDVVIPFNYLDNLKAWRIGISVNTFRFNSRLDSDKLKAALERLCEKEGWKKLGARVKKTSDVCTVLNTLKSRS